MDNTQVWILTSNHWHDQADRHVSFLSTKPSLSVQLHELAPSGSCGGQPVVSPDEPIEMVEQWSKLLNEANLVTRYNDPVRTVRRIHEFDPVNDDACPYIVYGRSGGATALLAGEIRRVDSAAPLGPLARFGPSLVGFEVFETATVVEPGPEPSDLDTLLEYLVGSLLDSGAVDSVRLHNIESTSPAANILSQPSRFNARGFSEERVRWWAQLNDPETGTRILKPSKNARRHFNKLIRAFDGDAKFEIITDLGQVEQFATAAASIVKQTYQAAIGVGAQDTPAYRALLAEMAEAGSLRGYLITGNDEPIAYVIGDRWGHTFSLWALSFLPQYSHLSPGTVAVRKAMESLADEGVVDFDFGWGDAEYKKRYGDRLVDELDFVYYSRRIAPSLEFGTNRVLGTAKAAANEALSRLGARDKVRKMLRDRQSG